MKKRYSCMLVLFILMFVLNSSVLAREKENVKIKETLNDFKFIDLEEANILDVNVDRKINEDKLDSLNYKSFIKSEEIEIDSKDKKSIFIFDSEGNIISVDQFSLAADIESIDISINSKIDSLTEQEYIDYIINKYVPKEYSLIEIENTFKDIHLISCRKPNKYGVINDYDKYKITVNVSKKVVLGFNKISEYIVNNESIISREKAENIAIEKLIDEGYKIESVVNPEIELTVKRENDYFENVDYLEMSEEEMLKYTDIELNRPLALVYSIKFQSGIKIYVDALKGVIVGGTEVASKDAMATFGSHKEKNDYRFAMTAGNTNRLFRILGYNSIISDSIADNGRLARAFVQGDGNNYAFSFSGHASPTSFGNGHEDSRRYIRYLSPDQVRCCWDLVILNGCSTADHGDYWSNAFGIRNNSYKKAFIGWYAHEDIDVLLDFSRRLTNCVEDYPRDSIFENLNRAISKQGTYYHVRFIGDSNYDGRA